MREVIIPARYILTKEDEILCFPGVAYYMPDGQVKNEILWGYNKWLGIQISGHNDQNIIFAIYHVFVERYIQKCLKRPFDNVEIFNYYFTRGNYPEIPHDIKGDIVGHLKDDKGNDIWSGCEHVSGPYLSDAQFITSQFSAGRLDDISPKVTENLVLDRNQYLRNPQNLPMLGIILEPDEVSVDQRYLEDLLLRTKEKKKPFVN